MSNSKERRWKLKNRIWLFHNNTQPHSADQNIKKLQKNKLVIEKFSNTTRHLVSSCILNKTYLKKLLHRSENDDGERFTESLKNLQTFFENEVTKDGALSKMCSYYVKMYNNITFRL